MFWFMIKWQEMSLMGQDLIDCYWAPKMCNSNDVLIYCKKRAGNV